MPSCDGKERCWASLQRSQGKIAEAGKAHAQGRKSAGVSVFSARVQYVFFLTGRTQFGVLLKYRVDAPQGEEQVGIPQQHK